MHGPYDNAAQVIKTLERTVGKGNFHFYAEASSLGYARF
jgi:hypothetical protein